MSDPLTPAARAELRRLHNGRDWRLEDVCRNGEYGIDLIECADGSDGWLATFGVAQHREAEAAVAARNHLPALLDAADERDKLQAFKLWVHSYLDAQGVPHHPPGPHGAEGCRIGDRMDWLMDRLRTAEQTSALQSQAIDAASRRAQQDAATIAGLAAKVLDARAERDKLRAVLQALVDAQAGPPLAQERHRKQWEEAMQQAGELLKEKR